jgi:hypothetical protein
MPKGAPKLCACAVGRHPRRLRIEERLAGGEACYAVGLAYGIGRETVRRHWRDHVPASIKDALLRQVNALRPGEEIARAVADQNIEPLSLCSRKIPALEALFDELVKKSEWEMAFQCDRRQQSWSEYASKISGQLRKHNVTMIQQNNYAGDQAATIQRVIGALTGFPEARIAVIAALRQAALPAPVTIEAADD